MSENERIVCEFLRKIAPSREWEYLGEVEHYWIGELCGELNRQLKAENARLRSELEAVGTAAYLYGRGDLKAENTKLREMVRDYKRCMDTNCDGCEYYGKQSTHCPLSTYFPDADEPRECDASNIEDENAKLRKLVRDMRQEHECCHLTWPAAIIDRANEMGVS